MSAPRSLLALALLGAASPAAARAPVNQWLCEVLKLPFDAPAAIAAFPLEKLPAPEETRKDKPRDDGTTRTSVTLRAEGERYAVEYRYLFNSDDVSDPYGYSLQIEPVDIGDPTFVAESTKWLREMGKPINTAIGDAVFAGPPMYEGGAQVFRIEQWSVTGDYTAAWQDRRDLRYAVELCK